jgi:hypothetical protein
MEIPGRITSRDSVVFACRLSLHVEEVVRHREPPRRKMWETRGLPRILIIGAYRMGFEIAPAGAHSKLRVFIEYNLPTGLMCRILGCVFAPLYARWCVRSMVRDARRQFL